jgi:hypothetical protein
MWASREHFSHPRFGKPLRENSGAAKYFFSAHLVR